MGRIRKTDRESIVKVDMKMIQDKIKENEKEWGGKKRFDRKIQRN